MNDKAVAMGSGNNDEMEAARYVDSNDTSGIGHTDTINGTGDTVDGAAKESRPYGLMTALRDDALGIVQTKPRLWWQVPVVPGVGGLQLAYQIQLASSEDGFGSPAVRSTGEVESSQSTAVPWPFEPLKARSVSFWRVRVRIGSSAAGGSVLSDWSEPKKVVVGPLEAKDWDGAAAIWTRGGSLIQSPTPGPTLAADAVLSLRLKVLGSSAGILVRSAVDCNDGFLWRLDAAGHALHKMHIHNGHERAIGVAAVPDGIDLHDEFDLRVAAQGECVCTSINGVEIDVAEGITKDGAAYGFKMGQGESVAVSSASIALMPQAQNPPETSGGSAISAAGHQPPRTVDTHGAGEQLFAVQYHEGCEVPPYAKLVDGAMVVPEGSFGLLGDALPGDYWAFLRHEFDVPQGTITGAYLYVAGLSPLGARQHVYRAWVNGGFVGVGSSRQADGPAYETFDVTRLIKPGDANAIALQAWAQAGGRVQALLDVRYDDGRVATFVTGPDWQGRPGLDWTPWHGDMNETVNYFVAPREDIDARREPFGWKAAGYRGDDFCPVQTFAGIEGLRADESLAVRGVEIPTIKPTMLSPGRWLFDTGMERSYSVRCHIDVPSDLAGTKLTLRMGEELNDDGSARFHLRGGIRYEDTWILRAGEQDIEHWGYRCFRYLEIDTDQRLDLGNAITFVDLVAPEPQQVASFASSDNTLDEVWNLCANTLSESRADLYIDTPTRERMPYEADLLTHGRGEMVYARSYDLVRKTSRYLARNPGKFTEYKFMTIQMAYQEYVETGDPDELARDFGLYEREQGLRWLNDDGLIEKDRKTPENDDIVDWPQPSEIDGFDFTRVNTVVNAWQYGALRALAAAAGAVGRSDDARRYDVLADRMREAMNEELFDASTGAYRDGRDTSHTAIHSSMYAAAFSVPAGRDDARRVGEWLMAGGRLDDTVPVSCNAVGWLIEALYRTGQDQAALEVMRSHSATSWWSMMHRWGATQTMEAWNPEIKPNTSFSHPWGVTPIVEIARWVLGVNVTAAGGSRIVVAPHPADLDEVRGDVMTMHGPVSVEIKQREAAMITVKVPGNTKGMLRWPLQGHTLQDVAVTYPDGHEADKTASADGETLVVPLSPGTTTVAVG